MVVTDVERNDIEFISRTLGCQPIAHVDSFTPEKLGSAQLCAEVTMPGGAQRVVKITGVANPGKTCSVLIRGSNKLTLDEADRSVHDALCVVRSLVKIKYMISGGGVAETELAVKLTEWSKTQTGMKAYCIRAYAEALEVVPYTLAENAGLNPINIVTELRKAHAEGNTNHGINVKKNCITDMVEANVMQPLLVNTSAITLATECVCMILKIDDVVPVR
jgi:T-complex protein 1 subunit delta